MPSPPLKNAWACRWACALIILWSVALPRAAADAGKVLRERMHGASLEKTVTGESADRWVSIYLPPTYDKLPHKRYPVVYLLHALGDTDAAWMPGTNPYGSIHDLMDRGIGEKRFNEMILVMPDERTKAGGSMYTNSEVTGSWEDFTARDLVSLIDGKYRTLAQARSRGVAGFSMGGHGAIKLGMKHPDVFSVVYAMNPAALGWGGDLTIDNPAFAALLKAETPGQLRGLYAKTFYCLSQAFSPNQSRPPFHVDFPFAKKDGRLVPAEPAFTHWEQNMPLYMVKRYQDNLRSLRGLRLDTAWEDEYTHIPLTTRALSRELTNLGIDHIFEEYNGDHRNRRWGRNGRIYGTLLPYFWFLLAGESEARPTDDARVALPEDLRRLQGSWRLVSATRDGKPMPKDLVKVFRCTIEGNHFSITRDGRVVEQGVLLLDPANKGLLDIQVDGGPKVQGIYEVGPDTYRQCYAVPGKHRPRKFEPTAGSGHSLSVWKRE
jgi:uncharacterized protein (TIGR03067 family)